MSDEPTSPALPDDELPETLERLIKLTLTLSDQMEEQTKAINRGTTMAIEARHAAEAARKQTDPELYGELVGATIDGRIGETLTFLRRYTSELKHASEYTQDVLTDAESSRVGREQDLWEREQKLDRFKSRLPWLGLGVLVCALLLAAALPRFLASYPSTCTAIGALWTTTTTGVDACVYYQK